MQLCESKVARHVLNLPQPSALRMGESSLIENLGQHVELVLLVPEIGPHSACPSSQQEQLCT